MTPSSPNTAQTTPRQDAELKPDAGREAIWKVVHEVWQLLDDSCEGPDGREIDEARWQAVSEAMDALEALVPDSEGPFWGGFPVNYLWPKAQSGGRCPTCNGYGFARGGSCWTCNGSGSAALSLAPEAGEEGVREAIDFVKEALDFAYRHGLHEIGYDPIDRILSALSSTRSAGGEVALSASDRACYDYPGVDQGPLREAFVSGAIYASPQPARMPTREQMIRLRDWIAREVPIGTESATYWLTELDDALFHPGETKGDGRG